MVSTFLFYFDRLIKTHVSGSSSSQIQQKPKIWKSKPKAILNAKIVTTPMWSVACSLVCQCAWCAAAQHAADIQVCQKGDYWSKSAPNGKSSLELLYNDWPCSNYATTSYTPTDWTWQGLRKKIKVVYAVNQNPRVLECKSLKKACLNGGLCVLFRKNCECTCTHIKLSPAWFSMILAHSLHIKI